MEQFQRGRAKGAGLKKYHKAQHPQAPKLTESVQPRVLNPKDSTANFLIQNSINSNGTIPARKSQRSWYEKYRTEKYHKAKHRQGIGRAAWIEFWSRCKSVQVMQGTGWTGPPGRCAINPSVHGPGGTCSEIAESYKGEGPGPARRRGSPRSGDARRLRPSGSPGAGRAPSSGPSPATERPGSPVPNRSVPHACRRGLAARCPGPGARPADWPAGLPYADSAGPPGPGS